MTQQSFEFAQKFWGSKKLYKPNPTPRLRSGLYFPHMEHHTIELSERTWLEIEYEVDAGVEGSYNEAPSNPFVSIQTITLCQLHEVRRMQRVEVYGDDSIDDTLFPIDMGMIEFDIEEKLRR